jgi:hypothetical protein
MRSDVSIEISYVPIHFSLEGINMKTKEIGLCKTAKRDIKYVIGWLKIGIITKMLNLDVYRSKSLLTNVHLIDTNKLFPRHINANGTGAD